MIRLTEALAADPDQAERCRNALHRNRRDEGYDVHELLFSSYPPAMSPAAALLCAGLPAFCALSALLWPPMGLVALAAVIGNMVLYFRYRFFLVGLQRAAMGMVRMVRAARKLLDEPAVAAFAGEAASLNLAERLCRNARALLFAVGPKDELQGMAIVDLVKICFNYDVLSYNGFVRRIERVRPSLHCAFRIVGETDAALGVGALLAEERLCRPQFVDRKELHVEALRHPLVKECVPNDLDLDGAGMLLSGSNMSGKTTFVRAMGIGALMAETVGCCFASVWRAPYLRLHTAIRIEDSVARGCSYYLEEVLTVRRFIEAMDEEGDALYLTDELFKGTNTVERIAVAKAVLGRLNGRHGLVVASTHDTELVELLAPAGFRAFHFCERIRDGELAFDYRRHEGSPRTSNALRILALYNYPPDVVTDALATRDRLTGASVLPAKG